ncbi:MAG: hypothetical protein R3E95_15110 [Thiolinea sp.]
MILRLKVVRKMYELRFGEPAPARRSVQQLRGIEGARVRKTYELLAQRYGVTWKRRNYDPDHWDMSDVPNRCMSAATACLYGITEAAVLAAGYAPAMGSFIGVSRCRLFMILLIFSSLIRSCRLHSRSRAKHPHHPDRGAAGVSGCVS